MGPVRQARIREADRIEIIILSDNYTDVLMTSTDMVTTPRNVDKAGMIEKPPLAEHGFSALIDIYKGKEKHRILFDTGSNENVVLYNADLLGLDLSDIEAVVISHGHQDHTGGIVNVLRRIQKKGIPVILHPNVFLKHYTVFPPDRGGTRQHITVSEEFIKQWATVVKIREPYLLANNLLMATGEIRRITDFETGSPASHIEVNGKIQPYPLMQDDQAVVASLSGKGLVIISGCSHSGIVNTILYSQQVTRIKRVYLVMGGFHLTGKYFEPRIDRTVEETKKIAPKCVAPSHCTGWKATLALANAMPDSFIQSAVGIKLRLVA